MHKRLFTFFVIFSILYCYVFSQYPNLCGDVFFRISLNESFVYEGYNNFINNNPAYTATIIASYPPKSSWFTDNTLFYHTNIPFNSVTTYNTFQDIETDNFNTIESFVSGISYDDNDQIFTVGNSFIRVTYNGGYYTGFVEYTDFADLKADMQNSNIASNTNYFSTDKFFSDGTLFYRTNTDGPTTDEVVVYSSLDNLVNNLFITEDTYDISSADNLFSVYYQLGLTCPESPYTASANEFCQLPVTNFATDNCDSSSILYMPNILLELGVYTITAISTVNSNTETCSFIINLVDNTPPSISCPNYIVLADNICTGYQDKMVNMIDNCDSNPIITYEPDFFLPLNIGQNDISATAIDNKDNSATCNYTVTVVDETPPIISCPSDYTVFVDDNCFAFQNPAALAFATDNCNLNPIAYNPDFSSQLDVGTHSISATATDSHSNAATCNYLVTVLDIARPSILCPQDIILFADENCENIMPSPAPISIADNCPNVTFTQNPLGGILITEGIYYVELIANDASDNTDICSYNVQVEDINPPVFLNCTVDTLIFNNDPGMCFTNVDISVETQSVADNCGIKDIFVNYPYNGYNFPVGISNVNATVIDTNNLETQCIFSLISIDNEQPTIVCPNDIVIDTENSTQVVFYQEPIITDNCPSNLQISNTANPGDSFSTGITTITYSAFDGIYNVTCSFTITINQILPTPSSTPPPSLIILQPEQVSPIISNTPTRSKQSWLPSEGLLPSKSITLLSNPIDCSDTCDFGEQETILSENNEEEEIVRLITNSGDEVGNLVIPEDLTSDPTILSVIISSINEPHISPFDGTLLGSTIIDITITDYFGNDITFLNDNLRICLKENFTTDNTCLGFFNTEKQEWECEDECLDKEDNETFCGTTDHLTSFALLLNGKGNKNNPCDSSSYGYILAWISLGLLLFSIIIILIAIILNESIYFYKKKKKQRLLKEIEKIDKGTLP